MRIPCIEKPRPKSIYTRYARRTQFCAWKRQRCSLLQGLFGLGLRVGLGLAGLLPSLPWLSVFPSGLVSGLPPGGDKGLGGGPLLLPPGLGFGLFWGLGKRLGGGPLPGLGFGLLGGGLGKGLGGGRPGRVGAGLSFLSLIKLLYSNGSFLGSAATLASSST